MAAMEGNHRVEVDIHIYMYNYLMKALFCDRSMWICQLTYRFPILLDAATAAVKRKGDKFLARWADIMTGNNRRLGMYRVQFFTG